MCDTDKPAATKLAARMHDLGFRVLATAGTAAAIRAMGIPVEQLKKIGEGSPNVADAIRSGDVDIVINTPAGRGARADGWEIRRAAIERNIPCITTMTGASAAARAIGATGRDRVCARCRSCTGAAEPAPLADPPPVPS